MVSVYSFPQLKLIKSKKVVTNNAAIKSIEESSCGLRVLDSQTLATKQAFQDRVEKTQWNCCAFDRTGEYILCDYGKSHNCLNIYERHSGQLINILEPASSLLTLVTHPTRSLCVSCTTTGQLEVWGVSTPSK